MNFKARIGVFETNSSSTHSLILTNERELEKDLAKKKCEKEKMFDYGGPTEILRTKEDKVYFLAGTFDEDKRQFNFLEEEYKVFLKVLKDNKEKELLKNIKDHQKEYFKNKGEPYCTNYFEHNPLCDCTCCFHSHFQEYFKINISSALLDVEFQENMDAKEFLNIVDDIKRKKIKELYNKISEFLYGDGVIVAYDDY